MRKSFLLVGVGSLLVAVLFWIYLPALSKYRNLRTQQEQTEQEIAKLDAKIQELTQEKDLLKDDPQYLEKVIREQMGLVKPGEIVYKFIPEQIKEAPLETSPVENPAGGVSSPPETAQETH